MKFASAKLSGILAVRDLTESKHETSMNVNVQERQPYNISRTLKLLLLEKADRRYNAVVTLLR